MIQIQRQSLFVTLGIYIVLSLFLIMGLHMGYTYFSTKSKIIQNMETSSKETILSLEKNIALFIESFAVAEYENLIFNELKFGKGFAIVVDNYKMGKIMGVESYVSGKIKDESGEIVDFDPANSKHIKQLNECFYVDKKEIVSESKEKLGLISICLADEFFKKELKEIIKITLVNSLLVFILLNILLFVIIKKFMFTPISKIIFAINDSDKDGIPTNTIPEIGSKEIFALAKTMNTMICSIKASRKELNDLNETLESRIISKTEEIRQKDSIIHEHSKRRALDSLLIDLAHHWRQPLNSASLEIQDIEDLLDGGKNDDEIRKLMKIATDELFNLSNTITRLTHFYELEAGNKISFENGLKTAIELSNKTLKANGINVEIDIYEDFYVMAEADEWIDIFSAFFMNIRDIIQQRNLGGANVLIATQKLENGYQITIEDDVGGIKPELLPDKLFDAYVTTTFKSRDKGLGLYIVRNIIAYRLGGTIEVSNTEKGAKFLIRIPNGKS